MIHLLNRIWTGLKELGAYIGDFQARWLLTVFYFVVATPFGLILRLFSDPLRLRPYSTASSWMKRSQIEEDNGNRFTSAQQQF